MKLPTGICPASVLSFGLGALAGCLLFAATVALAAEGTAANGGDARFKGAGKADPIRVSNVKYKAAAAGQGMIAFDLAWDGSWRATLEEPADKTGGTDALKVEAWDAAWVFVKFRKGGADGWSQASLSPTDSDHTVPDGATFEIGASEDGKRALGVFIHRKGIGNGPVDWKGVNLRWLLGADGMDGKDPVKISNTSVASAKPGKKPAVEPGRTQGDMDGLPEDEADALVAQMNTEDAEKAEAAATKEGRVEIQLYAIRMVYVPQCAFWVGDGTTNGIAGQFSAGDSAEPFRIESEAALTLGGVDRKNLGNRDNLFATDDFSSSQTRTLSAAYPKGFAAFYCMMREITRGEMAAFLNTLSGAQQEAMMDFIGEKDKEGKAGIKRTGTGLQAKYEADELQAACAGVAWRDALAFSAWAGLRPMTELEFEKACRGPVRPVSDEYAWGTPTTNAAAGSDRVRAGASYWGLLDLTGSLVENTVSVGSPSGRQFNGAHGDGRVGDLSKWDDFAGRFKDEDRPDILAGLPGWWMLGSGMIWRGAPNEPSVMRMSDRSSRTHIALGIARPASCGFRAVRSAGAGRLQSAVREDSALADGPRHLFNEQVRIANVAIQAGDGKTASIKFDIAWDDSWRNETNYDAAWVFFKVRPKGAKDWSHAKLAASQVLNPTGYGQEAGAKLEFVVPDGPDGFTGVFLQRAEPGSGPLSAKGVTVVADLQSLSGSVAGALSNDQAQSDKQGPKLAQGASDKVGEMNICALAIEMVYVPEGPFFLGSGGTEKNCFYKYTDGSQDTLPYQVTDAGPIPTGPQDGRLWATGVQPDGSDAGEIPAAFPNGFRAFYCMKYQLRQGQVSAFLGMQSEVRSGLHAGRSGTGWPLAKVGTAFLQGMTWAQGAAFGAWAGLRPMTELEFEKAWRGPRKPVPDETGPGYWGIRELASDGLSQRMVSVAHSAGLQFAGTHGNGSTTLPKDWPQGSKLAVAQRGDDWMVNPGYGEGVSGARPSLRHRVDADRETDNWRGVRTAPALKAMAKPETGGVGFKLELSPLPAMGDQDVAIFHLAGKFHNAGDQALPVELIAPLPDACFPEGGASRAFMAAPKSATEFKILTVVTRQTARAIRRVQSIPVSIRKKDGEVLAETTGLLQLSDPMQEKTPVIGTCDGGKVTLSVGNSAGQLQTVAVEAQAPPELVLAETSQRVEVPAGKTAVASFVVGRRDASVVEGFYSIPYRVIPSNCVAQAGTTVVEVRLQSRWWVSQSEVKLGPNLDGGVALSGGDEGTGDLDLGDLDPGVAKANPTDVFWNVDAVGVFKAVAAPSGWQKVKQGAALWPRALKPVPKGKTIISAATRVIALADRTAILKFGFETDGWTWLDGAVLATIDAGSGPGFYPPPIRVWINGKVVRDSRPGAKGPAPEPVSLKKGTNTMLIQFETGPDGKGQLPHMSALFLDAKDGAPIQDLTFDMEVKP